jgi:hypothetical protein
MGRTPKKNGESNPDELRPSKTRKHQLLISWIGSLFLACLSISIYAYPLWSASRDSEEPVLDELHLLNSKNPNQDIECVTPISTVFSNDYWGRPLDSPSSHRSWRPLTILSIRYLNNHTSCGILKVLKVPPLFLHR